MSSYSPWLSFPRQLRPAVLLMLPLALLLGGCGGVKHENMLMFDQVQTEIGAIDSIPVLKIRPDDILSIIVSSTNPQNMLAFQQFREIDASTGESALGTQEGYRVDEQGNIYLPFIGQVRAGGKTISQLREEINVGLQQYFRDASVQVRFTNFRVTLLGEVNRPNTYIIPNERLTILEAIGMAGDFTAYASRNEVLVIRERDSMRQFARVNMQNKELFRSPYFYLSPNDIVYVRPLKARQYATQGDFFQRYGSLMFPLVSLLTFIAGLAVSR